MKNSSDGIWNVIYWLISPFCFVGFMFSVGMVGQIGRHHIYFVLNVFSLIILGLTLLHLVNLILGVFKAKPLFKARLGTTVALILISFLTLSWTNYFRPAPKLKCQIDLSVLKNQMKIDLKADSVIIKEVVIHEEIYFPKLVGPQITVFNASLDLVDSLYSIHQREEQAMLIGQKFADIIYNACEMRDFNDIMINFLIWDEKNQLWKIEYINHYYNSAYE